MRECIISTFSDKSSERRRDKSKRSVFVAKKIGYRCEFLIREKRCVLSLASPLRDSCMKILNLLRVRIAFFALSSFTAIAATFSNTNVVVWDIREGRPQKVPSNL